MGITPFVLFLPNNNVPHGTAIFPLNPSSTAEMMSLKGPPEKSVEAGLPSKKQGFSYRNVLGELCLRDLPIGHVAQLSSPKKQVGCPDRFFDLSLIHI